jgi:hypothetical protein
LERPLYLDDGVRPGQRVRYRVTAVDRASPPNESAPAETDERSVVEDPATGSEPGP